eukprot:13967321-Alexandrium_andersonii.AAC.1
MCTVLRRTRSRRRPAANVCRTANARVQLCPRGCRAPNVAAVALTGGAAAEATRASQERMRCRGR